MYKHILVVLFLSLPGLAQQAPYVLSSPFGYGQSATGGSGGTVKTVTNRSDFATAVAASGKAIILVSGTLTFGEGQMVKSVVTDKTIIGLPGAKLVSTAQVKNGGIWQISNGSNNVIIRNLIFEGPGAYDVDGNDLLFNQGTNIWVDHCEFYDGVDGNFDNSNNADNVTITWNKFGYNKPPKAGGSGGSDDHRFSNLVSGGDGTYPSDGRYNITFAYNWWGNGTRERMPRARNAQLHLLNNYVNTDAPSSKAIGLSAGNNGTDVYVENCDFEKVGRVLDAGYGGSPKVTIAGSSKDNGNTNGGTARPTYSYTAIPWESVKGAVTGTCGAGAKLQVNQSTGAVSCGGGAQSSSSSVVPSSSSRPSSSSVTPSSSSSIGQSSSSVTWTNIGSGEFIDNLMLSDAENAADWSVQSNFKASDGIYGDRDHLVTAVPANMQGAEWVRTAMNSRLKTTPDTIAKFNMKKQGTVYIAYEDRVATKPAWLAARGFTASGLTMTVTENNGTQRTFTVYSKLFAQGATVAFGPNSNDGLSSTMMYLIAVNGEGITPVRQSPLSALNSNIAQYFTLRGEPLGTAKPKNAGVYIMKQGSAVRKIIVNAE